MMNSKLVITNQIKYFFSSKLGIDKAIGFTVTARFIQAIGGFVSLFLIASHLTSEEQGFYYTFGSILAIQIFFELGFNSIITQYAAHETAHIHSYDTAENDYERIAQSRLSSLLHFCIKWFSILALGLFVILMIAGNIYFKKYGQDMNVNWKIPWIILVANTSLSFLLSPIMSFLEGLGRVKDIAKLRLVQQLMNMGILWLLLIFGYKLYSAPIAGIVSLLVALSILFFSKFQTLLKKIWVLLNRWKIDYKSEIFPYQWKIALSWISGYFVSQLFNPVLFATEGAVIAGQMGMTLTLLNGIQSLSMSWMTTKVPLFSQLIALKDYLQLDKIFNKTFKQFLFINAIGLLIMLFGIYIIRTNNITIHSMNLGNRFLDYIPMLLMMGALFLNQFVFAWAIYLRCHKQEPLLWQSIVIGILSMLSTIIFGKLYGAGGITTGYFLISIISFIWAYKIFINKKYNWHNINMI